MRMGEMKYTKGDLFADILIILAYIFSGFYLIVLGIETIPYFDEKWNGNIFVLFYALGVMGVSVLTAYKVINTILDGIERKPKWTY